MWSRSFVLVVIAATVFGCGKSESPAERPVVDAGSPSTSIGPADTQAGSAEHAPGQIEMPADVDVSSLPTEEPALKPEEKTGGFEMPPLDSDADPVIVQRPPVPDVGETAINLVAADLAAIKKRVAESKQVCVVDFWSLSCEPCLKEFPGLVNLDRELGERVTCISVNVDFDGRKSKPAETYRPRVNAFLQSTGGTFDHFLCETPNEEVYAALNIVSIPAVLVYDAEGNLVRTFTDAGDDTGFGYEADVTPLVKSLVGGP